MIATFLIFVPFYFEIYKFFPNDRSIDTVFGEYVSNYFEDIQVVAWTLSGKIIPFICLSIWFATCKHWWYHTLLVPICMYAYQIVGILNDDLMFVDEFNIYILAPIIFCVAIFSYTIRTKIFDKIHGIDLSELQRVSWNGGLVVAKKKNKVAKDIGNKDKTPINSKDSTPVFVQN